MENGGGEKFRDRGLGFGSAVAVGLTLCTYGTVTNGQHSVVLHKNIQDQELYSMHN